MDKPKFEIVYPRSEFCVNVLPYPDGSGGEVSILVNLTDFGGTIDIDSVGKIDVSTIPHIIAALQEIQRRAYGSMKEPTDG